MLVANLFSEGIDNGHYNKIGTETRDRENHLIQNYAIGIAHIYFSIFRYCKEEYDFEIAFQVTLNIFSGKNFRKKETFVVSDKVPEEQSTK